MEREDDAQLVRAVLAGADAAFDILVEKYQKSVHAFVWQKIGDFHYAEEITQDTFLRAYHKLSTLRNPSQFSGWLYAIAKRLCQNWLHKQKSTKHLQSLEDTPMAEVAKSDYARYASEQRETEATEHRFEIVKKLLEKLPESERTAIALHYLGEMTLKEISRFLGVPVETVKVRLYRARKRLREEEELLIQEVLGGVQISSSIRENIMREVVDMTPTSSPKIVCGIAFAGCGLKHNEKMPHHSIRLQAKADAESDASRDVNALAYFGAGMSAPLAVGTCCLMAGGTGVLIVQENVDFFPFISISVVSATILSIGITDDSAPPNPPPERLIGKSSEYIKFYAAAYRSKMRSYRMRAVAAGSILSGTAMTVAAFIMQLIYDSMRASGHD